MPNKSSFLVKAVFFCDPITLGGLLFAGDTESSDWIMIDNWEAINPWEGS